MTDTARAPSTGVPDTPHPPPDEVPEAEARYRALVETTPVVSYTNAIGSPSTCRYISPQIEALTGYTPEEWMAEPGIWQSLLHPEDREAEIAKDAEHNESGAPYSSEYRLVARDGREVWVRDEAVIVRGGEGEPDLWQGVMVEVTDRKLTELQLRARAKQQEAVAELGRLALSGADLTTLMDRAMDTVCETLSVGHCELLQRVGEDFVLRAGRGWDDTEPGAVVARGSNGLPGFTLSRNEPVVVADLATEDRFTERSWLAGHGAVSAISVLVRGPEAPWGVLAAMSTEPRDFPSDDVYFLRAIANVLALVIQRARVDEQRAALLASEQRARADSERARERLRFLAEASTILSSSLDYEATLSRLAHLAVPEIADWCIVYRLTDSGAIRRLTVVHADPDGRALANELQSGIGLDPAADSGVPKVIRTGRPILHPEADAELFASDSVDPRAAERVGRELGIRSWMCVPLSSHDRTIGAISFITSGSRRRFDDEDLAQAMELARHAALAVDNARLYQAELEARRATERAAQRTALLQAVTAALSEALGPTQVAEIVVDRCVAAMGATAGVVALLTQDGTELEIIRVVGYREEIAETWARFPVDSATPMADAVRTEEPVFLSSRMERDERYPRFADEPMDNHAVATVPLVVESRAIGAMTLSFGDARPFPPEDRAFLLALARQAAQALERSRLYQAERDARAEAERANDRLAFLAEASEILSRSLDYRETMGEVARLAVPRLADWCTVEMLEEGEIVSVAVAHVDPDKVKLAQDLRDRFPPQVDAPTGVPNVIRSGQPELWPEIPRGVIDSLEDPDIRQLLEDLQLRSVMIVPLKSRGHSVGAITFVWAESGRTYGSADLALAQDLARRGAQAVENAVIYSERDYIARTLQQSLLPPDLPHIPGLELAARYLPAGAGNEVGGDFYDVFDTGDGAWGLAIGDVCGKGPDAAAVMGLAKYSLRAAAMRERRPSEILDRMNEAVMRQTTDGRFLTVAYVRIRPDSRSVRLTVSCGGHPLPTILRADGTLGTAGKPGTLLGLFPDPELSDDTVDLGPGDVMVVYTDGVTDVPGAPEEHGEARLGAILVENRGASADEIADAIEREVMSPRQQARRDDVAFVIMRVLPTDGDGQPEGEAP
ncbi:MAG TPA: GAF domain-containing protein [Actinomycetota bacterium]|jgi:PAS domain S-box-containing protein